MTPATSTPTALRCPTCDRALNADGLCHDPEHRELQLEATAGVIELLCLELEASPGREYLAAVRVRAVQDALEAAW